jgi:hypothetical protein
MNEIESAKAPHSARFVWKTMIQAVSPAIHIAAPIADITTSKDEMIISYSLICFSSMPSYIV